MVWVVYSRCGVLYLPTSWCPVVVGKPMLIILLGVGVDSYEAFWPDGAWAQWWNNDVFDTHYYENTDEAHDLADHSLLFWTAAAFCLPLIRFWGLERASCSLFEVGWWACLDIPLAHIGGIVVNFGVGWLRACRGLPDIPLVYFGGLECYS